MTNRRRHVAIRISCAFLGFVAGLAAFPAIFTLDDLRLLPRVQSIVFLAVGLLLAGLCAALGALVGGLVAYVTGDDIELDESSPFKADSGKSLKSIGIDDSNVFPRSGSQRNRFGANAAKYGWIFALVAMALTFLSAMSTATTFSPAPLLAAVPIFFLSITCTLLGIVAASSKITTPLVGHIALGAIVNFCCLLTMAVVYLLLGNQMDKESRGRRATAGSPPPYRQQRRIPSSPRVIPQSEKPKTLQHAVQSNDLERVQQLIDEGQADLNIVLADRQTLLIRAAKHNLPDMAQLLLENGADVDGNKDIGWLPLNIALKQRYPYMARMILEYGPGVNLIDSDGYTPLHLAVIRGYDDIVKELLTRGADASATTRDGATPLEKAAEHNNLEIARMLIANGADPNAGSDSRLSPLQLAAQKRSVELAQCLIDNGADVDRRSRFAGSPLHLAVTQSSVECAKLLLQEGADHNIDSARGTPLEAAFGAARACELVALLMEHGATHTLKEPTDPVMVRVMHSNNATLQQFVCDNHEKLFGPDAKPILLYATVQTGKQELAQELLDDGADVSWDYGKQRSLISAAISSKNRKLVELLLKAGAPIDSSQVLTDAINRKSIDILRLLLEHGADVNAPAANGYVPIQTAIMRNFPEAVELLLVSGVDVNASTQHMASPLLIASSRREIVKVILRYDPDVTTVDHSKSTALHYVARLGDVTIATALLERGAAVDARDRRDETPLIVAVDSYPNQIDMIKLLLAHKANVGVRFESTRNGAESTPLHRAASSGRPETLELLLASGADINARNAASQTPLYVAAKHANPAAIRVLLEHGADPTVKAKDGLTPRALAEKMKLDLSAFEKAELQGMDR